MLYQIDLQQPTASQRVRIRHPADLNVLEKQIEEFLTTHLFELVSEDKLMLIGQERSLQEEADLLARIMQPIEPHATQSAGFG